MENDGLFDPQCKRAFEAFCRQHQLVSAPLSEEAALRFMLHEDGAHLASITLPSDEASCAAVFRVLVEFARRSGLRIRDPQASRDVDLESPGNYPPLWKG